MLRIRFTAAAVVVLLALAVGPAAAHGELFFQLGAERVQPGGTVELRADLGAGEAFDVTLISKPGVARRHVVLYRSCPPSF